MVTRLQDSGARLQPAWLAAYHGVMRIPAACLALLASVALAAGDPADDGSFKLRKVDLSVAHPDGSTTRLEVVLPARVERPRPTVLFVHGFWVGPENYRRTIENLASRGYAVALFDQIARDKPDLPAWVAAGQLALDTLERAVADRRSGVYKQLDLTRLGVMGHSYGGMTTIGLAAVDSRVKAAVALAPGAQSPADFMRFAASIQETPVLVITTEHDATCPSKVWGRPAWDAIPSPRKLYLEVAKGDHMTQGDFPSLAGNAPRLVSRRYANAWLDRWLLDAHDPAGFTDGRKATQDPELSDRAFPPPPPEEVTVSADGLKVRAGPGASHPVVTTLARGAQARVLERKGSWCRVTWEGAPAGELWVSASQVKTAAP